MVGQARAATAAGADMASARTLKDSVHQSQLVAALSAVRVASTACMKVQSDLQSAQIVSKEDDSPVTVADYACQAIVAWMLQQGTSDRCGQPQASELHSLLHT